MPVDANGTPVSTDGVKTSAIYLFIILFSAGVVFGDPLMTIEESAAQITMKRGEKVIFHYNKQPTAEAADNEPLYTRTGYIHPVYSPSGKEITGDFAADHPHQHGLFFAWTKTSFEDRAPEFWNQRKEAGRVSYVKTITKENGEKRCSFSVEHLFEDLTAPGGAKPVLKEVWEITGIDQGDDVFVFEIISTQSLIGENPLTIEKYHYGGMAIRGNDAWFNDDKDAGPPGKIETNEGLDRIKGNHTRPNYVTMHGPLGDSHAGITVYSDPENFRHPQWVRLHPSKPYFVFAPMVEEPFQIEAGTPYQSRYRYLVFDGKPDAELMKAHRISK